MFISLIYNFISQVSSDTKYRDAKHKAIQVSGDSLCLGNFFFCGAFICKTPASQKNTCHFLYNNSAMEGASIVCIKTRGFSPENPSSKMARRPFSRGFPGFRGSLPASLLHFVPQPACGGPLQSLPSLNMLQSLLQGVFARSFILPLFRKA